MRHNFNRVFYVREFINRKIERRREKSVIYVSLFIDQRPIELGLVNGKHQ